MKSVTSQRVLLAVILAAVALLGWMVIAAWLGRSGPDDPTGALRPAPVEVAPVERGPIALRRTFSGELEALAEFVVAPKVSGRVERVLVNIADAVIVPEQALTERSDRTGVFVVSEDGRSVRWREVAAGIRADGLAKARRFRGKRQTQRARGFETKFSPISYNNATQGLQT